jgi:sialate O-acetylesterase
LNDEARQPGGFRRDPPRATLKEQQKELEKRSTGFAHVAVLATAPAHAGTPMRPFILCLSTLATFLATRAAWAEAISDVSEIGGYIQIYQLNVPDNGAFDVNPVPYTVDNSSITPGELTRIGFYLELDDGTGRQWVWASMNAFTQDLTLIGVPTLASGAFWEMTVSNMNVESNVPGIVTGIGIDTGNIEFWPYNYSMTADDGIGGSSSVYDFDDSPGGSGNYGSMQIHNYGAGQTLLAYNDWGGLPNFPLDDLGIGNNTTPNDVDGLAHPDWTLQQNAGSFTLKSLEVWVQPIPEPSTVVLLGAGYCWWRRRKR